MYDKFEFHEPFVVDKELPCVAVPDTDGEDVFNGYSGYHCFQEDPFQTHPFTAFFHTDPLNNFKPLIFFQADPLYDLLTITKPHDV